MAKHPLPLPSLPPTLKSADLAKMIIKQFDKPVAIEVGDLQKGLKKGRLWIEKGTEVIIVAAELPNYSNKSWWSPSLKSR